MTGSPRSRRFNRLASFTALALVAAGPAVSRDPQGPLPIYVEDNHAGTFQFLAEALDLEQPHVLVLVDAHSDSSTPRDPGRLREGLRRVASPEERQARVAGWRRAGDLQSFDWILPLMPSPIARVIWVRQGGGDDRAARLPDGVEAVRLDALESLLSGELPLVASIDLDAFAGLAPAEQGTRFSEVWTRVVRLPRLSAISFAVSRPWLADAAEASRLLLMALHAAMTIPHASIRLEPWGIEGPDRSERAKELYLQRREPPRFDPETVSPELRSLLLANADRLDVRLDPTRWSELLSRWRAETGEWRVALDGVDAGADGVLRPRPDEAHDLRIEGGLPGRVRRVTWLRWTPKAWSYNVLPDLPAGKVFAGAAPPIVEFEPAALARTSSLSLPSERWMAALPGPDRTGVLRLSAEVETDDGVAHTARVEIRRGGGDGFRGGLAEQFGLPYVFGAGFLRRGGLRGPDTGVGNDCANFLVYAWRRSGLRMPWSNPAQLRRHLVRVAEGARDTDRVAIPPDAASRGLVVHLGSHVAALWEDRAPVGTLGPEDLVIHHLGGAPEVISLARLVEGRAQKRFDLYLGPSREAVSWIAVGGDVMPGESGAAPALLRDLLGRADFAVANLETTVGSGGQAADKRYDLQVMPSRLAELRAAGIRAVSLANNHAGDFGEEGLTGTLRALLEEGIGRFGAGEDVSAAIAPWPAKVNRMEVAFVSVTLTDPDLLAAGPARGGRRSAAGAREAGGRGDRRRASAGADGRRPTALGRRRDGTDYRRAAPMGALVRGARGRRGRRQRAARYPDAGERRLAFRSSIPSGTSGSTGRGPRSCDRRGSRSSGWTPTAGWCRRGWNAS